MSPHPPFRSVRAARGVVLSFAAAAIASAQPANDACSSAVNHAIDPSGGTVFGTVVDATNDGLGCGSNRLPSRDVYHSFVPTARGPWRFELCDTASGWDTVLSIHRHPTNPLAAACPTGSANRIAGGCDDDGCNAFFGQVPSVIRAVSLEPGVRYTVRIAGFDGASVTDTYQLNVLNLNILNDRCEDADQSPIDGAGGFIFGDLSDATTDGAVDAAACLGSLRAGSVRDVYHLFTPQTTGRWTFSTCFAGGAFPADTVVSIHSGCPATAANAVACNNDGCESRPGASVTSANLVAGVTYRIRVAEFLRDRFDSFLGTPQYTLSVTSETTGRCCSPALGVCSVVAQSACPAGSAFTPGEACSPIVGNGPGSCAVGAYDQCSQAVMLDLDVPVAASTSGLTGSAIGSCSTLTADGWFRFTAPMDGDYQLFAQPDLAALGLVTSIFPGAACPASAATELDCGTTFGEGPAFSLPAGGSVTIRIAATGAGRYTVRVTSAAQSPPANDLCPNATTVLRNVAVSGTFTGATGGLPAQTCSSGRRDAWYAFTAPNSVATRIVVTPSQGSGITTSLSVSTTCQNAATPLACAGEPNDLERPTELVFSATAGTTYRIRISTNFDGGDFSLLVSNAPGAPVNDTCPSAPALSPGVDRPGSTRFAQGSAGAIADDTCANAASPDVWFLFRPVASGPYQITATPDTPGDAGLALGVFAGCPTNQAKDLACVGPLGPGSPSTLAFLVTAATDYLIRVTTAPGEGSDFSIRVDPSPDPLGACCARDGDCFVTFALDCTLNGGTYRGDGIACINAVCPPSGRCCFANSSSCTITSQTDCIGPGTTFTAGASCDPVACPAGVAPPNDLCENAPTLAFPAQVVTALDLADAEGPAIPGGFCGTSQSYDLGLDRSVYFRFVAPASGTLHFDTRFTNFPEPMIVLYRGTSCAELLDVDCTFRFQAGERRSFEVSAGQTYFLGLGIRNDPNFFNDGGLIGFWLSLESTVGACCRGTTCSVEDAGLCTPSGVFQGAGVACGTTANPTTCCPANFNGLGGVTVQDIFDFLNAYFANAPAADFNDSGTITVQDIFDFLTAYFIAC